MIENSWCETLPAQPRIWDPTRLGVAMECWRKHWLQTIRGLRKNGPTSVHLEWGKAYHRCVEHFDNLLLEHDAIREEATLETISLAFDLSWDPEAWVSRWGEWLELWQCTDPEEREHKKKPGIMVKNRERCQYAKQAWFEIPLIGQRCAKCGHKIEKVRQWIDYHSKKTRRNLLRAVAYYCDSIGSVKPFNFPDGTSSVEVQARIPLSLMSPDPFNCAWDKTNAHVPYELLVNIDSIVEWQGNLTIRERKTTGINKLDVRYWRQFELNPQIDSYDLAASILYIDPETGKSPKIMIEVTRITSKGEVEIVRQVIHIPEERREEWLRELQGVIREAESKAVLSECNISLVEDIYRRNAKACHGLHGTCAFFPICTAPSSEREAIIAADYHVERWDPLAAESFVEEEME